MRKNVIYTFVLGLLCIGCSKQEIKFDIEKEKYYEYGTSISLDADDYLIFDECSEKEKQKVLEQAKVKIIGLENEEGKTYPKINNYIIQICYKDKILETKVIVDDKTKPTIDDIKDIHLKQNQQNYDFSKHIQVRDLQKVNLEFQTKAIDFTKPGKYKMKVVATDASQNKSEKDVIVYVDKEEKNLQLLTINL